MGAASLVGVLVSVLSISTACSVAQHLKGQLVSAVGYGVGERSLMVMAAVMMVEMVVVMVVAVVEMVVVVMVVTVEMVREIIVKMMMVMTMIVMVTGMRVTRGMAMVMVVTVIAIMKVPGSESVSPRLGPGILVVALTVIGSGSRGPVSLPLTQSLCLFLGVWQ